MGATSVPTPAQPWHAGDEQPCLVASLSLQCHAHHPPALQEDLAAGVRTAAASSADRWGASATMAWEQQLRTAVADGFKRLLLPSLEREWRRRLKDLRACVHKSQTQPSRHPGLSVGLHRQPDFVAGCAEVWWCLVEPGVCKA